MCAGVTGQTVTAVRPRSDHLRRMLMPDLNRTAAPLDFTGEETKRIDLKKKFLLHVVAISSTKLGGGVVVRGC